MPGRSHSFEAAWTALVGRDVNGFASIDEIRAATLGPEGEVAVEITTTSLDGLSRALRGLGLSATTAPGFGPSAIGVLYVVAGVSPGESVIVTVLPLGALVDLAGCTGIRRIGPAVVHALGGPGHG